jgi:hypothetical protein
VRKIGAEFKCEKVDRETQETTKFFFCGIEKLTLPPNPRWSTHLEYCSPWVTKTQVLKKSTRSPSPERWVSNCVHQACIEAPTISKSSPRTPKSPRPFRSRQTPRVTSPHTFSWPEHSAKPCLNLEHSLSLTRTPQWRGRESQMARTHSPSLLGYNRSSE